MKLYRNEEGFTLIELLIVIAMIGILATMALPSFQDRVIRVQVEEALALSEFVQEEIESYRKIHHRLPADNAAAGLPAPEKIIGNYVESITVRDGAIDILMGSKVNLHARGKILTIRPAVVDGEPRVPVAWVYGNATEPEGMKIAVHNYTTLESRFLPVKCRI